MVALSRHLPAHLHNVEVVWMIAKVVNVDFNLLFFLFEVVWMIAARGPQ
jgi:hypothetical protein